MVEQKISRRKFFYLVGGVAVGTSCFSGCGAIARVVVVRLNVRNVVKVVSTLIRIADGIMTVSAIVDKVQEILTANIPQPDVTKLVRGASLIIEDADGKQFMASFNLFGGWAMVQSCNPSGSNSLHTKPSEKATIIRNLNQGENLGLFDSTHIKGWYHVKTVTGEVGWVHGNCLTKIQQ